MKTLKQYTIKFIEVSALREQSSFPVAGVQNYNGLYIQADKVDTASMSQSWQLDATSRIFENDSTELETIVMFKWGEEVKEDKTGILKAYVLQALEHGFRIEYKDGTYVEYNRFLRSPSGLRAGGALMTSDDVSFRRRLFALGFDETTMKEVVSKWESKLSLSITSSHPIPTKKEFVMRVVPDVQREVQIKVKHLKEYESGKTPTGANPCGFTGLDNIVYDVLSDKKSRNGNADIQFYVGEAMQTRTIECVDGTGIAKADVFDTIHDVLQMTLEEIMYCRSVQVRAPYVKGMLHQFDIIAWCDANNIATLTDIYGEKFDPRECDIIIPESMFKGSDLFKSMREYYDHIHVDVEVNGTSHKLFPNNEWFRVANINKKKAPMHEMTYQYIQAMLGIGVNDTQAMAQEFIDVVRAGVTENPAVAKKLLGLINNSFDMDDYNKSMVSKAQELLELCPAMFYNSFVQNQLIKCVETAFNNMAQGRIPMYGGYHFITGDISLLLLDDSYRVVDSKGRVSNRVLTANDKVGLVATGKTYLAGENGESVLFRSPLIHPSEVVKATFETTAELDKWFGHLTGIIIMNSYEPMALCMGGADYDGDKVYKSKHPILLRAYTKYDFIIISPLESLKANKQFITRENIFALDKRTMDNYTGIYTDMGTYYVNELYHTLYTYNQAIATIQGGCDVQVLWDIKCTFFPSSAKLNPQDPRFADQLLWSLQSRLQKLVAELDYKITIIRIAQAGEIDFPKHGTRFPLPMQVETDKTTVWLKPHKVADDERKPADKKQVMRFVTPMQFLFDAVQGEWSKIVSEVKAKSNTVSTEQYLMGRTVDNGEFIRLLPVVRDIASAYNNEVGQLRETSKNDSEDNRTAKFKELYKRYIALVDSLSADRQALAKACVYVTFIEKSQNASMSFPFVVAYDGILMNLAEFDHQSVRIIPVDSLDVYKKQLTGVVNVLQAGTTGVYSIGGNSVNVELPVELPVGAYNLVCVNGKHYIELKYVMTAEQKDSIVKHYFSYKAEQEMKRNKKEALKETKKTGVEVKPERHSFKAVKSVNYDLVVNGLRFNGLNAETAMYAIENSNNMVHLKEVEVKGIKQIGVFASDKEIGIIARIDAFKVKDNELIDLSEFVGHAIKVKSIATNEIYGKNNQPLSRIKLTIGVQSNIHHDYTLNAVHDRCDLSKWYWNVKWNTFADLGFTMQGVDFMTENPKIGQHLANVRLAYQGIGFVAKVTVVGGEESIRVESITNTMNLAEVPMDTIAVELKACILRACSYFFAKRLYDEEVAVRNAVEEAIEVKVEDMVASSLAQEEQLRKDCDDAITAAIEKIAREGLA